MAVLSRYGRAPPRADTVEEWLALCGGDEDLVVACLERLGSGGHLDKPWPYLRASLERAARDAAIEKHDEGDDDDDDGWLVR